MTADEVEHSSAIHSSPATTAIYTLVEDDELDAAVARM